MATWMRPVGMRIEDRDRHWPLAWIALGGLVLGGAMAVFGLPPVDIHGIPHYFGIMDPLCGGTRSVWAAMSGDLATSWRYNPLGIVLVVGAAATLVRLALGGVTGRWINLYVHSWRPLAAVGAVLFILLEVRQQLNADLLATPPEDFSPVGPLLNGVPLLVGMLWVAGRRLRSVRPGPDQSGGPTGASVR